MVVNKVKKSTYLIEKKKKRFLSSRQGCALCTLSYLNCDIHSYFARYRVPGR